MSLRITKKILLNSLIIIITGILYFFGNDPTNIGYGYLMWIAPILILYQAYTNNLLITILISFLGYLCGGVLINVYLLSKMPAIFNMFPFDRVFLGCAIDSAIFTLIILISRFVTLYSNKWFSVFIFPALWTIYEYNVSIYSPGGSIESIAYSQMHWVACLQIAAFLGISGITFLLLLVPSTLVYAYTQRFNFKQAITSLSLTSIIVIICLILGQYHINQFNSTSSVEVGLAAIPENFHDLRTTNPHEVIGIIDRYAPLINQLAESGAKIILLPEKIMTIQNSYESQIIAQLQNLADLRQVTLIIGLNQKEKRFNSAIVLAPHQNILLHYVKQKLVSFSPEGKYISGTKPGTFIYDNQKLGVIICHDMDYASIANEYGTSDVKILFAPAEDFVADDWRHARVSILRGVENGYSVVRAAQFGFLSISDQTGQISQISEDSYFKPVTLFGIAKYGSGETFYAKHGNWFILICLVVSLLIIIMTFYYMVKNRH